jgi:5-methyltetrahydrofolate--homocysteine methyltransferase
MPLGCSTEQWCLDNPQMIMDLQRRYAEAGSQILMAPTFQAQPAALRSIGLEDKTEQVNAKLVALSRQAAPNALIAGNITTLATYLDYYDENIFDTLVDNYRRQIRGLMDGGADLLAAETLLYQQDAEAILTAAELEGAGAVTYTFTMQPDGSLFSGMDAIGILRELEEMGAAAVGFNCVAADQFMPALISKMKRQLTGPIICKPNAGNPIIAEGGIARYPMKSEEFASIMAQCADMGASVLGGCCGTTPEFIRAMVDTVKF